MSAIIVDGKSLAKNIEYFLSEELDNLTRKPRVDVFVCSQNKAIKSFVRQKRGFADRIGVHFVEHVFTSNTTTDKIADSIHSAIEESDGIVVQLPMAKHIDTKFLLNIVPDNLDIDVLGEGTFKKYINNRTIYEPPVAGAIKEILQNYKIKTKNKRALIIGRGKLVGMPAKILLKNLGCQVSTVDKETNKNLFKKELKNADIIVSGAGVEGLVTPEDVKSGVVLLDAGTSGSKGALNGDISYQCDSKASLFARSPGGIGPLTVAILFKNLYLSAIEKNRNQ